MYIFGGSFFERITLQLEGLNSSLHKHSTIHWKVLESLLWFCKQELWPCWLRFVRCTHNDIVMNHYIRTYASGWTTSKIQKVIKLLVHYPWTLNGRKRDLWGNSTSVLRTFPFVSLFKLLLLFHVCYLGSLAIQVSSTGGGIGVEIVVVLMSPMMTRASFKAWYILSISSLLWACSADSSIKLPWSPAEYR